MSLLNTTYPRYGHTFDANESEFCIEPDDGKIVGDQRAPINHRFVSRFVVNGQRKKVAGTFRTARLSDRNRDPRVGQSDENWARDVDWSRSPTNRRELH